MVRKFWYVTLILFGILLLAVVVAAAQGPSAQKEVQVVRNDNPASPSISVPDEVMATTYITITNTDDDPNDGYSKKCSDPDVPAEECTLRRAINQAYGLSSGDRPVYIIFEIPDTDLGYDPVLQVWKIELEGTVGDDLRDLNGQTILDGSTQPGGRTDGPKIIIDGQDNKNYGLITRQDGNEIRGVAMQDFKNAHISVASNDNVIEDCWFGLSDDGTTLTSGDDTEPEGGSGVALTSNISGNTVRNNVFAGFFGVAAAIRGDDNVFSGNLIGTRADGTVPSPAQFDQHPCLSGAWTGGSGITVADSNNQIGGPLEADGNVFAGLYLDVGPTTTQRPAMDISGDGHLVQNNVIGLDVNEDLVGVCGRGIDLANGPFDMEILDNTIVEPDLSAIVVNHWTFNGNTMQGNIIKRESDWPEEQGDNNFPESAIAYGAQVPDELRGFKPALVTEIDGTAISGTSGAGSDCPLCTIEIFLDDSDNITETLQSLDLVIADEDGNWTATLPAPLEKGQGLRTMSTVPDSFTIIGLDPGTTSNLSILQGRMYQVFLPMVVKQK